MPGFAESRFYLQKVGVFMGLFKIGFKSDSNSSLQRATVSFGPETGFEVVPL